MNDYVSLSGGGDYQTALARLMRQQQFADQSQREAMEPLQAPQGAVAPISWTNVLAKAMQGWGARRQSDKIDERYQQLGQQDRDSAQALVRQLTQGTNQVGTPDIAPSTTQINPTMPQLPGGSPPTQQAPVPVQLPGAQGTGMQNTPPSMQQQMAAILGASGGPQTQMIQGAMLPQILNRQNLQEQRAYGEQQAAVRPATPQEKAAAGLDPKTPAMVDAHGNLKPITDPNQITAFQQQELNNQKRGLDIQGQTANKPQFVPYGAGGYMQGGQYHQLPAGAGGLSGGTGVGDPNSGTPALQLGISTNAFNMLTGNTSQVAKGRPQNAANAELDAMFARNNLDPTLVRPQVQAYGKTVEMNTMKANTMDTLAKEALGTIQNYGPVVDQLTGGGNLRLTNKGFELLGAAVNDPTAQKTVFYLNQLRADLAGFNAASGGKIGMHGQTQTDNADYEEANRTIQNGLSSGGARGLAEAVEATRQKNVAVTQQQVEEAQKGIWNALGLGPRYDATHPKHAPQGSHDITPQEAAAELARRKAKK